MELIVHHSDSYAANLVPAMIECGIDIWQGVMSTNDVPELIQTYGGRISFHGAIDNGKVDRADWTEKMVMDETRKACAACGKLYFIPGTTMGGPESVFPGVYDAVTADIEKLSGGNVLKKERRCADGKIRPAPPYLQRGKGVV